MHQICRHGAVWDSMNMWTVLCTNTNFLLSLRPLKRMECWNLIKNRSSESDAIMAQILICLRHCAQWLNILFVYNTVHNGSISYSCTTLYTTAQILICVQYCAQWLKFSFVYDTVHNDSNSNLCTTLCIMAQILIYVQHCA